MNSFLANIGNLSLSVLKSKWFWIALSVLIAVLIIRRYWSRFAMLFKTINGTFEPISDTRKSVLEDFANNLRTEIYTFSVTHITLKELLDELIKLNDSEFYFVFRNYKKRFNSYLSEDIKDEYLPFTNLDEEIISRAEQIGVK